MMQVNHRFLFWTPRILCMVFALFLSLFALDVFQENTGIGQTIIAFLIHLIPVYLVLGALAVAWKWEWIGAVVFIALGIAYIVMTGGDAHPSAYIFISGPLFLVGGLFWLGWVKN
jgi:hypothetical protein